MQPRPDNIFLITDDLPTIGAAVTSKTRVSSGQRLEYFVDAIREIPINTILFQIEGDPMATSAFWQLPYKPKVHLFLQQKTGHDQTAKKIK